MTNRKRTPEKVSRNNSQRQSVKIGILHFPRIDSIEISASNIFQGNFNGSVSVKIMGFFSFLQNKRLIKILQFTNVACDNRLVGVKILISINFVFYRSIIKSLKAEETVTQVYAGKKKEIRVLLSGSRNARQVSNLRLLIRLLYH